MAVLISLGKADRMDILADKFLSYMNQCLQLGFFGCMGRAKVQVGN
jgi:hypothetical protein